MDETRGGKTFPSQAACLQTVTEMLREMAYLCSSRTIPEDLNEWLSLSRPGYYVPFHLVFADEMPDAEDRKRFLRHLAAAPNLLKGGYIEEETGLIYCYSTEWWRRLGSAAFASLVLAIASVLTSFGAELGILTSSTVSPGDLAVGWLALLVGVGVHIAVDYAKAQKERPSYPPVVAPGEWLKRLDAKVGVVTLKIVLAVIAFFGFGITSPGSLSDGSFAVSTFLVGYSLDSVVDLFGAALDRRSAAQVGDLNKRLATN
jgi:hypothetical protein